MRDFLTSPIWQFVGVLLASIAIVLSIVLYFKQKRLKALSFEIISFTSLLNINDEIKRRVRILLDNQEVEAVHLAIIRIVNSGNIPIRTADYEQPITLGFGRDAKILSTEILEAQPKELPAQVEAKNEMIILNRMLMNASDYVTIKALISGRGEEIVVSGRIEGVKEITKNDRLKQQLDLRNRLISKLGPFVSTGAAGLFFFAYIGDVAKNPFFWVLLAYTLIWSTIIALSEIREYKGSRQ